MVAWQDLAALLLFAVGRADLNKLRLRCNLLGNVSPNLGLIAAWVCASILSAWGNRHSSGDGHKMRVAFVEGSIFEEEQDVLLNPELQAPDGKQNPLRLAVARCAPVFTETSGECLFLLVCWQFGQQESMTDTDFIAIESFDRWWNEVDQFEPGGLYCIVAYVISSVEGPVMVPLSPPKTT
jgi:hypothetical protein